MHQDRLSALLGRHPAPGFAFKAVAMRTAQVAMRRSSLELTGNVYADPRLLGIGAAVDALPSFEAAGGMHSVSMGLPT